MSTPSASLAGAPPPTAPSSGAQGAEPTDSTRAVDAPALPPRRLRSGPDARRCARWLAFFAGLGPPRPVSKYDGL